MRVETVPTADWPLFACGRTDASDEVLDVWIEGDGLAWKGKRRISSDPTPLDSIPLKLAVSEASGSVVYIARPGQFLTRAETGKIPPAYWTDRRFSEEVVRSVNEAVDYWKRRTGAASVRLSGYSGGGALAVLIADRRKDVVGIRTVAGNLDPAEVNRIHRVSPLADGPDPMDAAGRLAAIPQLHFTGDQDRVVPSPIARRWQTASGHSPCVQVRTVRGAAHATGWPEQWPSLRDLPVDCN